MHGKACLYYKESILTRINGHSPWNSTVTIHNRSIGPEVLQVSVTGNAPEIIFYWMAQNVKCSRR